MGTKERNISIDIMKFLAVLLITNSHMDKLYGNYNIFATGGAIGDVLFFSVQDIHFFLVHWDVLISGIKKDSQNLSICYCFIYHGNIFLGFSS